MSDAPAAVQVLELVGVEAAREYAAGAQGGGDGRDQPGGQGRRVRPRAPL